MNTGGSYLSSDFGHFSLDSYYTIHIIKFLYLFKPSPVISAELLKNSGYFFEHNHNLFFSHIFIISRYSLLLLYYYSIIFHFFSYVFLFFFFFFGRHLLSPRSLLFMRKRHSIWLEITIANRAFNKGTSPYIDYRFAQSLGKMIDNLHNLPARPPSPKTRLPSDVLQQHCRPLFPNPRALPFIRPSPSRPVIWWLTNTKRTTEKPCKREYAKNRRFAHFIARWRVLHISLLSTLIHFVRRFFFRCFCLSHSFLFFNTLYILLSLVG